MWYQIQSYFKFLIKSTNQHGVHSPFVFNLITRCFYDRTKHPEYNLLNTYRYDLYQNKESIEVTDFGAGSRVFTSNTRAISAIAKMAGITRKRQRLLYRLTHYFSPSSILELGTSLGLGTIALSLGKPDASLITVEGCPNTSDIAQGLFLKFRQNNIRAVTSSFEEYFSKNKTNNYDLVYIDGNHDGKKTLAYFDLLLKYAHNETVLIFDDIYWSTEMNQAWKKIISYPEVTVSIDTFYWGFIFFRKEQQKEHFKIRL